MGLPPASSLASQKQKIEQLIKRKSWSMGLGDIIELVLKVMIWPQKKELKMEVFCWAGNLGSKLVYDLGTTIGVNEK